MSDADLALASAGSDVIRRDLDLTASDRGCDLFLLSCGCDSTRYYRVAHGTGLIPNEIQSPCRTLVACLVWSDVKKGPGPTQTPFTSTTFCNAFP